MIQVITKEYKTLEEAVGGINTISLKYDYLRDYDIMKTEDTYRILLKFDIPIEYMPMLAIDTAIISNNRKSHPLIYFNYDIESKDKELENNGYPINLECFNAMDRNAISINGHFKHAESIDLVNIEYIDNGLDFRKFICIELNEYILFGKKPRITSGQRSKFVCENVDYEMIYNHIVNVYLQKGLLFDKIGLNELKSSLKILCIQINERTLEYKL